MIRAISVTAALAGLASALPGQQPAAAPAPPARGWMHAMAHYGKWATAATAIGFTVLAAQEHHAANGNWNRLLALCRQDNAACRQSADGRYIESSAEALYQRTVYYDQRARRRLIAGQVALLASAALFILDLRSSHGGPPNIPFHGLRVTAGSTGAGAEVRLQLPF